MERTNKNKQVNGNHHYKHSGPTERKRVYRFISKKDTNERIVKHQNNLTQACALLQFEIDFLDISLM